MFLHRHAKCKRLGSARACRLREPPREELHACRGLVGGRVADGARPRGRAEGRSCCGRGDEPPSRADARHDLPEAVDANARLVRGRHHAARRHRPLSRRLGSPAGQRRDDPRHGRRALALPRRDHDPDVRAVRRRGAGAPRVDPRHQRAHRRRAPVPGARRRDDDSRTARPAGGRPSRVHRGRQQRLRVARRGLTPARPRASSPPRRRATSRRSTGSR